MKDWTSKTQREMKKAFYGLVSRVDIKWNHKNATLKQDKAERRFKKKKQKNKCNECKTAHDRHELTTIKINI